MRGITEMPTVTDDVMSKADEIRTVLNDGVNSVRSNADLTTDARLRRIAKLFVEAQARMTALQEGFGGTSAGTATRVSRDLFGAASTTGMDAISARDADDRASRLENSQEATALLKRAEENGDSVLARAIAKHAYSLTRDFFTGSEWRDVLQVYVNSHPDVAAKLEEIEAATSTALSMASYWAFVLPKPSELDSMADYFIAGLV